MSARARQLPASRALPGWASLALCVCAALALPACYEVGRCGIETCDGRDDDCDGRVDEGFVDAEARYALPDHCGGCGLRCADVFPDAAATACEIDERVGAHCVITRCRAGERMTGDGTCVADQPVLCLPCDADLDCALRTPGARCLEDRFGEGRCGAPCELGTACPAGFRCVADARSRVPQCEPVTGTCACSAELIGSELACLLRAQDGHACAGVQRCERTGLSACVPALEEVCNEVDDDCDGSIDEGFVDAQGRYASEEHCGACARACVPSGPNLTARCMLEAAMPRCVVDCEPGFVDVDGLLVTGCECQLTDRVGVVIGGDADCDGVIDPTPEFIFVAQTGDDADDGEAPERAVRTIQRGLELGAAAGRDVLVARGIYRGPVTLAPGVSLIGGYSPDFRERDELLHPVVIEDPDGSAGLPMLVCSQIDVETLVDGFTVVASDADQSGAGSTAVYLDRCSAAVTLQHLTIIAGRGAPGVPGASSSMALDKWGLSTLGQLGGVDGGSGADGNAPQSLCVDVTAGGGAPKVCPRGEVSGGDGGGAFCPDLSTLCINQSALACGNAGCTDFTVAGVCDIDAARDAALPGTLPAEPGRGSDPGDGGHLTYPSPTNRGICAFCDDNPTLPRNGSDGGDGAVGEHGPAGEGCDADEVVDLDSGRVAAGGGTGGDDGDDGSGGGGATAGAGFAVIGNTTGSCDDISGGSGGGGGSGGCGAPGAGGGSGGGASVGVMLRLPDGLDEGPTLSEVRIVTASGGDGGDGGIGAAGGPGGAGGLGGESQFWCARNGGRGGDGGRGGAGGGGGGGCGGSSYGVFVRGAPAADYGEALSEGATVERAGVAGRGGAGGFSPGNAGAAGRNGVAVDVLIP